MASTGTYNPFFGGSGGASTVNTSAPASGDGSVGTPVTVVASSASVPGSMSQGDFSKLSAVRRPKAGAALTDADQTIQPFTDKASLYTQATALSASRTKTLGTTGVLTGTVVTISREDAAAFTMLVVNGGAGAGTLRTFAASPTEKQRAAYKYDGTNWAEVSFEYELST